MGLDQGSGAAPPSFSVLSGIIVNTYKQLGNGAVITSALISRTFILATVMYVDNIDLLHLGYLQQTMDDNMITLAQQHQTD